MKLQGGRAAPVSAALDSSTGAQKGIAMAGKSVTLTDPNGGEFVATSAAEINNLVFGAGYKIKGGKSVDEALAAVAEQSAEAALPAADVTAVKTSK